MGKIMKKKWLIIIVIVIIVLPPLISFAGDCWIISNIKGYSAFANENYKFAPDGLPNKIVICFTDDGGSVTGSDVRFLKFGKSTLAGYGGNDKGNEMFEVYQIDSENGKLLYTKTRIGTKTINPAFSDVVCSYIGDAKKINQ